MIKTVGFVLFIFSFSALALVPVEGILLGESRSEIQHDPFIYVFRDIYDRTSIDESLKVRRYHSTYKAGEALVEQCDHVAPIRYATSWQEKQAKRSVVATLQYIGLDQSVKAIGAYANALELDTEQFNTLKDNLIRNYCSQNLTVYSVRYLDKALDHYYRNPNSELIPAIESSPFATRSFKDLTQLPEVQSRSFDLAVSNFRAFCSWGGDVMDYRLLSPFLKNPYIMAFINRNLSGELETFDPVTGRLVPTADAAAIQVGCQDLICRKTTKPEFDKLFPLSLGASGLKTDLAKLYCQHFRLTEDQPSKTIPQVRQWLKEKELEDAVFESNLFISILTGIPDPILGIEKYKDLPLMLKSPIDERWNQWSMTVLELSSNDLLYEESINVSVVPLRDVNQIALKGFGVNLLVTLGELDRVMDQSDKIDMGFEIKVSRNHLHQIRQQWRLAAAEVDEAQAQKIKADLARYLDGQFKSKEKYFKQRVWNEDFGRLVSEELLAQVLRYQGPLFESYVDEMVSIPIRFSYGAFALSYIRYRADVQKRREKLKQ